MQSRIVKRKYSLTIIYIYFKSLKNSILATKSNHVFNIAKTIILESIDANLEIQKFKKVEFKFREFDFAVKKEKIQ